MLLRAKRALRAKTETETIERALDLVLFQEEALDSLKKTRGRAPGIENLFE